MLRPAFALSLIFAFSGFAGKFLECSAENNVIVNNIEGYWGYDAGLSESLGDNRAMENWKIRFTKNPDALAIFNEFFGDNLTTDTCAYTAGFVDLYDDVEIMLERPFVLMNVNGVPTILWLESYSEGEADVETMQIALAEGADESLDLLVINDDYIGSAAKFFSRIAL